MLLSLRRCASLLTTSSLSKPFHSKPSHHYHGNMDVILIPMLKDNYGYLIKDKATNIAAVVDPVEPETVLSVIHGSGCTVNDVLTTHHHWDHAGGNEELSKKRPGMKFYGGDERIGALNAKVKHGDKFSIGKLNVTCFETPCHTTGHICYLVEGEGVTPAVFTGDTLFAAGCGRFFEGTAPQMYHNLIEVLGKLPDETHVYCGHEYTVQCLKYALHVEPENPAVIAKMKESAGLRAEGKATIPTTIGEEKTYNPFMRVGEASVMKHCGTTDPVETMKALRAEKDSF